MSFSLFGFLGPPLGDMQYSRQTAPGRRKRMTYTDILYDVDNFVATITLNRPDKLNAWTAEMDADVRRAIERAVVENSVRAIVLTGAGRGFCAGADMSRLSKISA